MKLISNYWQTVPMCLITCVNICTNHNRSLVIFSYFLSTTIDIAFVLVRCLHFSLIDRGFLFFPLFDQNRTSKLSKSRTFNPCLRIESYRYRKVKQTLLGLQQKNCERVIAQKFL